MTLNHIEKINSVLEYIEDHLDSRIDLQLLAYKCALSKYHFHRIFTALTGEQPLKYVEKRRLVRACEALLETDRRIIDIAFDLGFGTHESFTRVFKKRFNLTPSEFRKQKPAITYEKKLSIGDLDLKLTGGRAAPNPSILSQPSFRIAGFSYEGRDTNQISLLWEKIWEWSHRSGAKKGTAHFFGACFHDIDMRNNEVFHYHAGYKVSPTAHIPKQMKVTTIPENTYAVFVHKGSVDRIEATYDQIYGNWLPRSDYMPTMDLDIIVIDRRFTGRDDKNEIDILIPVSK